MLNIKVLIICDLGFKSKIKQSLLLIFLLNHLVKILFHFAKPPLSKNAYKANKRMITKFNKVIFQ